jgi:hypothetical protein
MTLSKNTMRKFLVITVLSLGALFVACQKQQTEEERKAEIERQVQERLAAEHQQQQVQELAQREASVVAREQALKEKTAAPTTSEPTVAPETTTEAEGSYSTFYTQLEPYGDWIETADYGYVYRPREAANSRWRPYTNGQWVYTDAGWTWISDEPFGWATYHYGRWTRIRGTGWVWVPGDEWAPAWVSWRKGGQYVGWAPLPPEAHFDRARGIRNWSDNYYDVGPDQYVFVPTTDFGEQRVERVIVPEQQNVTIVNQTTNVTNITYNKTMIVNQGPSYDELRAQSRVPIQRLKLQRERTLPAQNARAVVRGETVSIPAPMIKPAQPADRPRAVKQSIKQAEVDRGWNRVGDQRDAEQARAKMKMEATPPPNAPPKKFVKPITEQNATPAPAGKSAATVAPPRNDQIRAITPARSSTTPVPSRPPTATATLSPSQPVTATALPATPSPSATFSITAAPARRQIPPEPATRSIRSATPASAPPQQSPATTVTGSASPSITPQATPANEPRQREKKRNLPRRGTPPQATSSPSPAP